MTDSTTLRRRGRQLLAATGTAALLTGTAALGLPAAGAQTADSQTAETQPTDGSALSAAGQQHIDDLGACLAGSKSADILLIMDESASLKGFDGDAPTDKDNLRVDAAKDLVKQLSKHADDLGADINVKLAGFGEGYRSDPGTYGGWENVKGRPDALDRQIDGAKDRNDDGYTQYGSALNGALKEFADAPSSDGAGSDCQAVLFFTDGMLTDPAAETDQLVADICTPGGALSGLRNSGIRFFTVGLLPKKDRDAPQELLTRMAEQSDCTGTPGNGAFFNAGDDPAGLLAAFRNFIPTANSVDSTLSMNEPQQFVLDNSVSPVRLSAQPTSTIDGTVTPVLTAPNGDKLELTGDGTATIGDAEVTMETTDAVNGMVDAELTLPDGGDWAGAWTFGYDAPTTAADAKYNVKVQLLPGLSIRVDELSDGTDNRLKSDGELHASLVDRDGKTRALDGEATMTASFLPDDGDAVPLGSQSAADGGTVTFPLDAVTQAGSGTLQLTTNITTKGTDDTPGTELSPVSASFATSISPVNMPTLGTTDLSVDSDETTVEIPVTGPGKVWVEPSTLHAGDDGTTLPAGVSSVDVSSPHADAASALELGKDEQGVLPLTVKTGDLADGRIALAPEVHLVSDNGADEADVTAPLKGDMTVPVDKGMFALVFALVLLAAIPVPTAVLYLMKWVTGKIPGRGLHALKIPVAVKDNLLVRRDRGGAFDVSFEELVNSTPRTVPSGRSVNLAGTTVTVKLGRGPLSAPVAIVGAAPSVSDEGNQVGDRARLPLAVHNHWFVTRTPGQNPEDVQGDLVIAVDQGITHDQVTALVAGIAANGAERLGRLSLPDPTDLSGTSGSSVPSGDAGPAAPTGPTGPTAPAAPAAPAGPAGGSPFGNSPFGSAPAGSSPFGSPGGPSTGSPFGGQGTPGQNPGPTPGSSPFGGPAGPSTGSGPYGSSPFGN